MSRALLQQALDALTNAQDALDNNQVTLEARQLTGFSKTCHGANSIALELGYDAIQALRTELAKPEPTQARDVFEMSLAYEGHRISKQITGIEIRNTRGIEKLILDTLIEMSKSMVTEFNKEQL